MCGIAGFVLKNPIASGEELRARVQAMSSLLVHRGPDATGDWVDPEEGISLGHRRLSILDLSEHAAQPMVSANGRWVLSYNGEIYNLSELREKVASYGTSLRSHSDTELLLEMCAHEGVAATLKQVAGMFAFALWDRQEKKLWLVRDRLGIKPLYWCQMPCGGVAFASELQAFEALPSPPDEVDPRAVASLLHSGSVSAPLSILKYVYKLMPGGLLCIKEGKVQMNKQWYITPERAANIAQNRVALDVNESLHLLRGCLQQVVREHMVADVPVGAFLSGGIDSSLVTAMMAKETSRPVQTFSIGFEKKDYDESGYAKVVADALGTEHTEFTIRDSDILELIPKVVDAYDEPFADPSQIPTFLVSQLASESVKVVLSGDGGDEVFAGYNRHLFAAHYQPYLSAVPQWLRRPISGGMKSFSRTHFDRLAKFLPSRFSMPLMGEKLYKFSKVVSCTDSDDAYRQLMALWFSPEEVAPGCSLNALEDRRDCSVFSVFHPVERMQALDQIGWLPNDILTKVDRATMAVSLEARVPLLDHRLLELAWRFPVDLKIRERKGKWILRRLLAEYLPVDLFERPKTGFSVPLQDWLRGSLRDWAESLLAPKRLKDEGWFDVDVVRSCWSSHLTGKSDQYYKLWPILMFQAWQEQRRSVSSLR
jgi:asparagine synthase (glutamine-hydrolysing)